MLPDRILVAYATRHGSTGEIAEAIGETLRAAGLAVDVRRIPSPEPLDLSPYRAIILGSAVYMNHWQKEALDFLRRHQPALRERPVWLFSSGPLDHSAGPAGPPAPKAVQELAARLGVRGHVTFGGRLDPEKFGFVERLMIRDARAGDWRDFEGIRAWAESIARALRPAAVG